MVKLIHVLGIRLSSRLVCVRTPLVLLQSLYPIQCPITQAYLPTTIANKWHFLYLLTIGTNARLLYPSTVNTCVRDLEIRVYVFTCLSEHIINFKRCVDQTENSFFSSEIVVCAKIYLCQCINTCLCAKIRKLYIHHRNQFSFSCKVH